MQSRRDLLHTVGLAAAAGALASGTAAASVATAPVGFAAAAHRQSLQALAAGASAHSAPWWLFAPLQAGASVGLGWRLTALSPIERGAAVLTLTQVGTPGAEARVHLCAHHGQPRGLAHSALFDLVLMDGGQGNKPTDEGLGRVLLGLAARLRRTEQSGELTAVARLLTHGERTMLYGPESLT